MNIRYIRNTINSSSSNTGNHWVQISAWDFDRTNQTLTDSSSNRAFGNNVSGSTAASGSYSTITNGDLNTSDYASSSTAGEQNVVVDLGAVYNIEFIQIWHYYGDTRIYFENCTEVSEDKLTWITIQNPTGNMVETASGSSYILHDIDFDNSLALTRDREFLEERLLDLQQMRGQSKSDKKYGKNVNSDQVSEFYGFLDKFNNYWSNIVSSGKELDNDQIEDIYKNMIRTQNNVSCKSGCSYACSSGCNTMCHSSCGYGCGSTCSSGCGANCKVACGSTCAGNCGDNCSATCAGSCTGTCVTGCSGSCINNCVGSVGGA